METPWTLHPSASFSYVSDFGSAGTPCLPDKLGVSSNLTCNSELCLMLSLAAGPPLYCCVLPTSYPLTTELNFLSNPGLCKAQEEEVSLEEKVANILFDIIQSISIVSFEKPPKRTTQGASLKHCGGRIRQDNLGCSWETNCSCLLQIWHSLCMSLAVLMTYMPFLNCPF